VTVQSYVPVTEATLVVVVDALVVLVARVVFDVVVAVVV